MESEITIYEAWVKFYESLVAISEDADPANEYYGCAEDLDFRSMCISFCMSKGMNFTEADEFYEDRIEEGKYY